MITNEPANLNGGGAIDWGNPSATALAPGAVAPQGMGGYPVALATPVAAPAPLPPVPRQGSMSSLNSYNSSRHMTTTDMLAVANSAAPPPTMDQVNYATQQMSMSPLGIPPNNQSQSFRNVSTASTDSFSFPTAPAPAAPPPPPPPAMAPTLSSNNLYSQPASAPGSGNLSMYSSNSYGSGPMAPSLSGYGTTSGNPFGAADPPTTSSAPSSYGAPVSRDPPSGNPFAGF